MKRIISFSGGKDSTALILWAKENLSEFETVFCDTGWESPITYSYIEYINEKLLGGKLVVIRSKKYKGFEDLCYKKTRVPSAKARFCTEELKLKPMKDYINPYLPNVEIYTGVRADESFSRSKLPERAFADFYGCDMIRPLLHWTSKQCFELMKKHKVKPNPLYKMGMKRVGCMPCIMVNHKEFRSIIKKIPEIIDNIRRLEGTLGGGFFPPNYIPFRYQTGFNEKSGKKYPVLDDVLKYLSGDPNQTEMFEEEPQKCMSYYSLCE